MKGDAARDDDIIYPDKAALGAFRNGLFLEPGQERQMAFHPPGPRFLICNAALQFPQMVGIAQGVGAPF